MTRWTGCPSTPHLHGPWWDRVGHNNPEHNGAYDATWEPVRRVRMALSLARTHSRRRAYHALHMLATGRF